MKFQRQKTTPVDVNMTPMIDVVFLLLIFFMVSTTFSRETRLTLELPKATGSMTKVLDSPLEITITATGAFGINGQGLFKNDAKSLGLALIKSTDKDNLPPLVIVADAKAPHQAVVTAMDVAGKMGFVHIRIASMAPSE